MQTPAAVLWDMDGTLIDSEHYWLASEQALAEEHGASWGASDGLDLVGMSLVESSMVIKQRIGSELEPEAIVERLTNEVVAKLNRHVPWRPGAKELLVELNERGIRTALVTMSLHRMAMSVVDALTAEIGYNPFDLVLGGDQVVRGKPHPEPYLVAAERLGVAIEDSLNGLTSAEASGAKSIGVPNVVALPQRPGRTIWPTLEGVSVAHLTRFFNEGAI
jgi:HAD superfamily hydrolase (TIGR01509 family)